MAKAAYPTIGIAALVMFGIVYFIGCLLLKALDLLKKRPVTNDRKNIKTGCTNHLIQPVFIFIGLYTTD